MKKYYYLLLLASLLACKQEKPKPICNDKNLESILSDSLGLRFLKPNSYWETCLDPQIDTFYQDFDLLNFKGIKDTTFSKSFEHDSTSIDYYYKCYYAYREVDSSTRTVVLADFHGTLDFQPHEEPYIAYYPTQFIKKEGIWTAKWTNANNFQVRSNDLYHEREAYFLIQEGYRMYYFSYYKKKYDDNPNNQNYDGVLYMFTDSGIVGFNHIDISAILNHKTSVQFEKCNNIVSTNKPSFKATYLKRYGYTFGIKGTINNETYSLIEPFSILGHLQFVNHLYWPYYDHLNTPESDYHEREVSASEIQQARKQKKN